MSQDTVESGGGVYKGDIFTDPQESGLVDQGRITKAYQALDSIDQHLRSVFPPAVMEVYEVANTVRLKIERGEYVNEPWVLDIVKKSGVDVGKLLEFTWSETDDPVERSAIDEAALPQFARLDRQIEITFGLEPGVLEDVGNEWCSYVTAHGVGFW